MKANKAPEKVYLLFNHPYLVDYTKLNKRRCDEEVEYTHTEAFIDRAWSWIEDNILSPNQQDKSRSYCKQFRNFMKGK